MKIKKLIVGQLQTNCYLVWDEKSRQTVIIDPGDDADFIANKIRDGNLKPKVIAVTHGHFDHVLAVPELKLALNLPFLLHQKDLFLLKRSAETAHYFTGVKGDPPLRPDQFIKEGDQIKFGKEKLAVIETPGHSPGGVVFYDRGEGVLFSGDTLFRQAVGRTDFSYGSPQDLEKSIKRLFKLPPRTIVYPGHGIKTKIGEEKTYFTQDLK
ncbi:MAG TPA: MBL fold metallo-hydrolase [Candidatus Bathyarchaeia archaeon]|nr:MBL fold metallo-hydrolase [Candidatus Bathyarchaeia archaeon]